MQHISAVTLATQNMEHAVEFYEKLGFQLAYGGKNSEFSTLQDGEVVINLAATQRYEGAWWGRVIFRVEDADIFFQKLRSAGLSPEEPRDAPWGERFFHVADPDGHELSFAQLLPSSS